jgi:hypothetical protein
LPLNSIADLKDFKKVESFKDCYIEYGPGDCGFFFQFFKNGKFTKETVCYYDNNRMPITARGFLYHFNDIYYAGEFFYFKNQKSLCTVSPLPESCTIDGVKKNSIK